MPIDPAKRRLAFRLSAISYVRVVSAS